ncbi:uncharacterized protein LOC143451442 isoform X3 [Clavelina lepadiformis]|uniref:uncharacterized protein LOC143451442 isoform X3 n=1 Tax=Clavelina lepadiformis TaxID=159417 RepID=UPI004040EA7A
MKTIEKLLKQDDFQVSDVDKECGVYPGCDMENFQPSFIKGGDELISCHGFQFSGIPEKLEDEESVGYGWYVLSQENGVVGVLLQTEGSRSDLRAIVGRLDVEKDGFQGSSRNSALLRGGNEISESG